MPLSRFFYPENLFPSNMYCVVYSCVVKSCVLISFEYYICLYNFILVRGADMCFYICCIYDGLHCMASRESGFCMECVCSSYFDNCNLIISKE